MRAICTALAMTCLASTASAATYVAIGEVPGGERTTIQGINGRNQIVGYYYTSGTAAAHGFVAMLGGAFTTFDAGTDSTFAHAISNMGTIVGSYIDDGNALHVGFERYADGRTASIKKDHQVMSPAILRGVSNLGVFVGNGNFGGQSYVAFTGQKGKFANALDTTLYEAEPHAVNASNVAVGMFLAGIPHGFILKDGVATQVDFPNQNNVNGTELNGINDAGTITGDWFDQHDRPHAFRYDMSTATFTPLHPPRTEYAKAFGINEKGLIAVKTDFGSFVYCPNARRCPAGGTEMADGKPVRLAPRPR